VRLRHLGLLTGRVRDPRGRTVVRIEGVAEVEVDSDGRFSLPVPVGTHRVGAFCEESAARVVRTVVVGREGAHVELMLLLRGGADRARRAE
jgi:hypothetical protein